MQPIYANHAASVSELKKNPTQLINQAEGKPIAILNHNVATAYLIPAATFEKILEALDEQHLLSIVHQRIHDGKKSVKVKIDEI